jgi:hypothetical protein
MSSQAIAIRRKPDIQTTISKKGLRMPVAQMVVGYILAITGALVLFLTALVSLGIIGAPSPAPAAVRAEPVDPSNRWKYMLKEIAGKISLPTVLGIIILLAGMIMCGGFWSSAASH